MNSDTVESQIRQLEALKAQRRMWSTGYTVTLFVVALFCILSLRSAVYGLVSEGETQRAFVTDLSDRLQKNAMPSIQEMASQSLREIDFGAEARKLNARTPELTQATLNEIKTLGDNLPKQGQQVLDSTFTSALKGREAKIHALYPNVTDAQVKTMVDTLSTQAQAQAADVSESLFGPHQKALQSIVGDLTRIQHAEPGANKEQPSWEMGLTIFDIARADLKDATKSADAKADAKSKPNADKESRK